MLQRKSFQLQPPQRIEKQALTLIISNDANLQLEINNVQLFPLISPI
jgi:hypothetical protein